MPSEGVGTWNGAASLPARRRVSPWTPLRWFHRNLMAERARWALWLPAFLGIGIGAYFWLTVEPPLWIGGVAFAAALAGATLCAISPRLNGGLAPALTLAAMTLGFATAQFQTWYVAAPVLDHRLGPVTIDGTVTLVDPLPEGTRLVIAPRRIDRLSPEATPLRVRVRLRHDAGGLVPGDTVHLRAILMPPPAPAMPGAYDFERRAYFDRLGAVGFALGEPARIETPPSETSRWRAAVEATRTHVTARIRAALPGADGAIASAIMTGATHTIAPGDAGAFRDAGLAHILVIAGLHMGMVAGIVFFAVRALLALIPSIALRYSTKKLSALAAMGATFLYLLLSDATVSSRRAFIMIALMLLGVMFDRATLSARTLAYAAVAIMLLSPESAAGPSFQMSFAAVAGLVACYEAMRPALAKWHTGSGWTRRALLYLFGIALTTVVTTVATMPFTIYHFNRFPLYSVLANILAVPITGFWIMPWAIVSCLMMPFGLEWAPLQAMGWGIDVVTKIAHGVTDLPGAVLHVPSMPAEGLILLALGGLWLCIWTRPWRAFGILPLAAGYASLFLVVPPDILVAEDGKLVAVRGADGLYLPSQARRANWTEDIWTQRAAAALGPVWPTTGTSADGRLSCEATTCRYRLDNREVVLARDRSAVRAECGSADLIVSTTAAHLTCPGALMVDSVDTWKRGGHAIWLAPDAITIRSVAAWRGERPWTRAPKPRALSTAAASPPTYPEP